MILNQGLFYLLTLAVLPIIIEILFRKTNIDNFSLTIILISEKIKFWKKFIPNLRIFLQILSIIFLTLALTKILIVKKNTSIVVIDDSISMKHAKAQVEKIVSSLNPTAIITLSNFKVTSINENLFNKVYTQTTFLKNLKKLKKVFKTFIFVTDNQAKDIILDGIKPIFVKPAKNVNLTANINGNQATINIKSFNFTGKVNLSLKKLNSNFNKNFSFFITNNENKTFTFSLKNGSYEVNLKANDDIKLDNKITFSIFSKQVFTCFFEKSFENLTKLIFINKNLSIATSPKKADVIIVNFNEKSKILSVTNKNKIIILVKTDNNILKKSYSFKTIFGNINLKNKVVYSTSLLNQLTTSSSINFLFTDLYNFPILVKEATNNIFYFIKQDNFKLKVFAAAIINSFLQTNKSITNIPEFEANTSKNSSYYKIQTKNSNKKSYKDLTPIFLIIAFLLYLIEDIIFNQEAKIYGSKI